MFLAIAIIELKAQEYTTLTILQDDSEVACDMNIGRNNEQVVFSLFFLGLAGKFSGNLLRFPGIGALGVLKSTLRNIQELIGHVSHLV